MRKRLLSLLLCSVMFCGLIPQGTMIASALAENGLCEHHNLHTEDCGYSEGVEGSPCTHEHTEDCYIIETNCVHSHDETCYSGEISADNNATPSNADEGAPTECIHVCSEECGCTTKNLNCTHAHGESCGYMEMVEDTPCAFVCEICSKQQTNAIDDSEANTFRVSSDKEFINAVKQINNGIDDATYVIEMTDDITITNDSHTGNNASLEFIKGMTTIYGNGHTLKSRFNSYSLIFANDSAVVNLGSAGEVEKSKLIIEAGVRLPDLLGIGDCATVNVYEGVVFQNNNAMGRPGGAISVGELGVSTNATLNMYGGAIRNCQDTYTGYGGAVFVGTNAKFNMSGGIIENNKGNYGGGVCSIGTFTMTGGVIQNNTASKMGDDIYSEGTVNVSVTASKENGFGVLTSTGKQITGWFEDGYNWDSNRWDVDSYCKEISAEEASKQNSIALKAAHSAPEPGSLTITPVSVTSYVGGQSASGNHIPTLRFKVEGLPEGAAIAGTNPSMVITMHLENDKVVEGHESEESWTLLPLKADTGAETPIYYFPTLESGLKLDKGNSDDLGLTGDFLKMTSISNTGSSAGRYKIELTGDWYITAEYEGQSYRVQVETPEDVYYTSRYVSNKGNNGDLPDGVDIYDNPEYFLSPIVTDEDDVTTLVTTDAEGNPLDKPVRRGVVVIPEDAAFYTNGKSSGLGSPIGIDEDSEPLISLFFDDTVSLSSEVDDKKIEEYQMKHAQECAADSRFGGETYSFDGWDYNFRYLDLVNASDGNSWVSCDKDITVYWPYPFATMDCYEDYEYQILHFKGMEREYSASLSDKADEWGEAIMHALGNEVKVEKLDVELTEKGLKFVLPADEEGNNMSPFVLMWKPVDNPEPEKYGSLTVSKMVAGNAGEKDKDFHFIVTLGDTTITGTYGEIKFTDGMAEFTLRHGESKTAANLPAGIEYEVTETEENQDGYVTSKTDDTGTITKGVKETAVFTNTKDVTPPEPETGDLTVSKIVTGNAGDKNKDFNFTVTLSDKTISGVYGDLEFTDGVATFTLKHGESKTAINLSAGIDYEVTETEENQDGYVTSKKDDTGTITKDVKGTAVFINAKDVTPPEPENPDKPYTPVITDTPNQDVLTPKTGDNTNLKFYMSLFIMSGLFLVILEVMYRKRICKKDN
ncbi:DUF7601 domain-containing protein [[Clostridium] innocuum]|uniref:DUF7601 domain-containing protein n=1 Tax=Clostridium innocuum TaxID=1522 RepID=UPI000D6CDF70|nr:DUF5979 domain-containing protein [[Clostridium] innocuum]PWJ13193.1 hypothetical protein ATF84_11279 [[Clostridium] innocuum]SSA46976.1 T surface-antigen of pili [[Clostridium] innocuum]